MTIQELIGILQAQHDNMGEELPVYVAIDVGGGVQFTAQVRSTNNSGDLMVFASELEPETVATVGAYSI